MILAIGDAAAQDRFRTSWPNLRIPVVQATLQPLAMGMDWHGTRVIAFAGIGNPAKFFATLRAEGADILREVALDDHQPLSEALLKRLEREALLRGAQLVTTEKDAVRLPPPFRTQVLTLPVRLHLPDWSLLDRHCRGLDHSALLPSPIGQSVSGTRLTAPGRRVPCPRAGRRVPFALRHQDPRPLPSPCGSGNRTERSSTGTSLRRSYGAHNEVRKTGLSGASQAPARPRANLTRMVNEKHQAIEK